ncbi:MAG TPA: hypothetical protein PKV27_08560, partial [Ilumatobacteraceae bacterium]|nr:hypothetical protein [Ilumatobacteraceae bacterium]
MTNAPTRILVICTGNLCRSPLAHALLRDGLAQRGINAAVDSAGTGAPVGSRCDRRMRKAAKDLGCDMSEHRARQVTTADIDDADLVLVMNEEHLADLKRLGYGDVLDRAVSLRTAAWRAHRKGAAFANPCY